MSVGDILSDIGKGAKAVGAAAVPVLERTAQVVSGEAPQIDEEKRKQQYALEDAQINAKAQALEAQLNMGQKYGTLTPEQQQQYVDQISGLYSHPRHSATLMEKLRKAVHPNGAYATGPQAPLPNATPPGGTAEADEKRAQELYDAKRQAARQNNPKLVALDTYTEKKYGTDFNSATPDQQAEALQTYVRESTKGSVGKSPPVPGTQLPPDATGPDGQPIGAAARDASHSFVEYNGSWWPVAKPKPVFKKVKGHAVLVDSQTGAILRDLGPEDTAKITTRQTLQPGDDGQMHLVNLTSVTTPDGAKIEVEDGSEGQTGAATQPAPSSPKTPAKKVNPGSILRPTGAKPAAKPPGSAGPVVPGLSSLAASKNPLYKSDVAQYTKVAEDANQKAEAYKSAQQALASGSTASSDQELIYSWVRSNVQGAGRMTQAEFKQAASVGSLPQRAQIAWERTKSGKLPPDIEQMLLADIKRSAETSAQEAADLRRKAQNPAGGEAPPPTPQQNVRKYNPATGRLE